MNKAPTQAILDHAERLLQTGARPVFAREYAMEPPSRVVLQTARFFLDEGWVEVSRTEAGVRPPFAWVVELTLAVREGEFQRHYLLLTDGRLVRANRKVLSPPSAAEVAAILDDLAQLP